MKLSYIFNIVLIIIFLANTSCSIREKMAIRKERKTACVVLEEKIKKAEQYYQNGELEMALQAMDNINEKVSGKCNDTYETALILLSKIQLILEDKNAEYTYKELLRLDPYFSPNPKIEPIEFQHFSKQFEPLKKVSFTTEINYGTLVFIESSDKDPSYWLTDDGKIDTIGFGFSTTAYDTRVSRVIRIGENISFYPIRSNNRWELTTGLYYSQITFQKLKYIFGIPKYSHTTETNESFIEAREIQSWIDVPFIIGYRLLDKKRLSMSISLGVEANFLYSADLPTALEADGGYAGHQDGDGNPLLVDGFSPFSQISSGEITFSEKELDPVKEGLRRIANYSILGKMAFQYRPYKKSKNHISLGITFNRLMTSPIPEVGEEYLERSDIEPGTFGNWANPNYIEDPIHFHKVTFDIGYSINLYRARKKKIYRNE
ncbi:MAG: hypothetical protein ACPG19_11920 [Saprospiraceae bacterium]